MQKIALSVLVLISLLLVSSVVKNNVTSGMKQLAIAQTLSTRQTTPYQDIVIRNSSLLSKEVNNSANFLVYKNPIYGIEIQYPSKWEKIDFKQTIDNNSNAALVAGFIPTSKNDTGVLENLMIREVKLASPYITTREFSNTLLSSYKQQFKNFQLIGSNASMTISGKPAYQVVYTYGFQPNIFKTMEVWVVNGDRAYMILYNADPSDYSRYLPTIHRMVSSFALLSKYSFPNII